MARIPQKSMPTTMGPGYQFARVPEIHRPRSVFDRSHGYKTTMDAGLLVPVFVEYAMPGDTFSVSATFLARLATPIKPFMDNMYGTLHFFAVPFRLIWANARKFFGEQDNPGDSIAFTVPTTATPATGVAVGSIGDYLGLPAAGTPGPTVAISVSALPFRAYHLTYNQWYRDENLVNSVTAPTNDGPDTMSAYVLQKRGKRHDYFTSCMPTPQKGASPNVALAGLATVKTSATELLTGAATKMMVRDVTGSPLANLRALAIDSASAPAGIVDSTTATAGTQGNALYPTNLQADLATATGMDLNTLRLAIATQQFLERDMRGGTRYIEHIYAQFGVLSSDARLQRVEYLGGGTVPVMMAPVAQMTQTGLTGGNTPIGNLSGVSAAIGRRIGFHKSFEEHCVVLGILHFGADLTYSQGLERFWSYSSRLDFPYPVFANIGEQAVLSREIYADGTAADQNVFGYQERYAERRYKPSKVTALFRPAAASNLSIWNLSELFGSRPVLGQTFIEDQTTAVLQTRVAVPSEPDFIVDMWYDFRMAAVLPVFGVPGLRRL